MWVDQEAIIIGITRVTINAYHIFEVKDVQLGHSYFIDKSDEENGAGMDIRFEYEIKPILLEYVKDGVLTGKGKDIKKEIDSM